MTGTPGISMKDLTRGYFTFGNPGAVLINRLSYLLYTWLAQGQSEDTRK